MILEQDVRTRKVEIDAKTGAEKVVEEKQQKVTAPPADATTPAASTPAASKAGGSP